MVSMLAFFSFSLKRRSLYSNCQREGKKEKKDDQTWSLVSVQTHQVVSSVLSFFFPLRSNGDVFFPTAFRLIRFSCLHSELVKDAP